ncbi:hypothetical protein [Chitinophaga sp.]|uniref:hypothetical protein n=1 Tax=Chitinophaga sp. TaxID=1869181 RepID=UPI0031E2AE30
MRILVLALALFGLALTSYGQNIYQIRADSVRIYNDCDTAEFILENHTQTVPGFLYNRGRGRTEFRRLRFIDLGNGQISLGDQDTLDLGKIVGGGGNYIKNQVDSEQVAAYRINGGGTQKNLTLTQPVTVASPLIMLGNGDTLLKAGGNSLFMGSKSGVTVGAAADANTAFGYGAMAKPTSVNNTAVGTSALAALTSGQGNVGIGAYAGYGLTTGSGNLAIGAQAGYGWTGPTQASIAIGFKAAYSGATGVAIGVNTLPLATTNNVAVGNSMMSKLTTGIGNIGLGFSVLPSMTTGSNNIAIGYTAGNLNNGSDNVFFGNYINATDTVNHTSIFGSHMRTTLSNVMLLGTYNQHVIVGPDRPSSGGQWDTLTIDTGDKFQVNGSAYILKNLRLAAYKNTNGDSVLTTDANGNVIFTAKGGSSTTNTVADLQNVTDTGNVTNNAMVITGHNKLPDATAGMEMSVDTSTEYKSQGLRANMKVYDYNTSTPGYLYVSGKGAMVENPENFNNRLRMHPESDGFHLDAEYLPPDYTWYQAGIMHVNAGYGTHTILGGDGDGDGSVKINGALATRVGTSRNIASDYMDRDAVTYLIVDATTTTIKMYEPSFCPNRIVTIKKTVNNSTPVKIVIDGAGLIDGGTSITITDYLASVQLQSDGTNYWILYRYKN